MSEDIVARLRAADEWMLVGLEGLAFHSDAPFVAADEIERLRQTIKSIMDASMFPEDQFQRSVHDLCNRSLNGGGDE